MVAVLVHVVLIVAFGLVTLAMPMKEPPSIAATRNAAAKSINPTRRVFANARFDICDRPAEFRCSSVALLTDSLLRGAIGRERFNRAIRKELNDRFIQLVYHAAQRKNVHIHFK